MNEVLEVDEVALAIVLSLPLRVVQRARETAFLLDVVREQLPDESEAIVDGVVAAIQRRLGGVQ